jgi:hypothetical protein
MCVYTKMDIKILYRFDYWTDRDVGRERERGGGSWFAGCTRIDMEPIGPDECWCIVYHYTTILLFVRALPNHVSYSYQ